MNRPLRDDILREPFWLALAFLCLAVLTIIGALAFEHIGGYQPCALCLQERVPYYLGIPAAGAAVLAAWSRSARPIIVALFVIMAVVTLYNVGLGTYHSGVEWGWWEGPSSCAPSTTVQSAGSVLESLQSGVHGPSCTEALWRFAGLSFAGWNVVVSLILAGLAVCGAYRAYGSSSASQ